MSRRYHPPESLGLTTQDIKGLKWVSLAQVAWTLEPKTFYPVMFNGQSRGRAAGCHAAPRARALFATVVVLTL